MKFDVSNFLRAATQAAHGTIAGHIQGQQERQAEQQNQFQRDLTLFHTGNQLENQQDERDANYDQGVASVLPHLNPADRAAWTQTLLQRASDRSMRPRRFGAGQFPGGAGVPGQPPSSSPAGAPNAGGMPTAPTPSAQPSTPNPQPPTPTLQFPASLNGVGTGPAPPAGAAAAPAPPGGAPAAPAPQVAPSQSPAQLAVMRAALGAIAPLVPGGQMMAGMLNQYHPPEVNPPAPADGAQMLNTVGRDLPGQPVVTAPVTSPVTSAVTTPPIAPVTPAAANPNAGALNIPGYPTAHLQTVDPAARTQVTKDIDGDLKALKDLQDADPATRQAIDGLLRMRPTEINTPDDLRTAQEIHSRLSQLMIGSGRTVEDTRRNNEKALTAQAGAIPRDNSAAIDTIVKLEKDYQHHNQVYGDRSTLPALLESSHADILEMQQAKASGDQDRAEEIAATIRGRLSAGVSPKEEGKRLGFVYKDIANLGSAEANDPKIIREIYAKNGLGYMVADSPDEALRAGGWRAQKSRDSLLKTVSSPGFARLDAKSQSAALDALREANKETGGTLSIPASIALRPDPLIAKKLALMDTQIELNGTRGEVAVAQLNINKQRLALDKSRFNEAQYQWAQRMKAQGGKKADKTWNRDALMHRDMWLDAERKRASFLKGIKSTEADYSTFTPQERATYNQLTTAAGDQKNAYVQFFTQHGVGVPAINAGGTAKPGGAVKALTAADAAGMSTADLMARLAKKYEKK